MKRAVVTVLKADISGSTPLGERLDPEELRGVLGAYFAALAREIEAHGGRVDKYIGDAVMAVFGLPTARPDDAARAIRAALAMQDAIAVENDRLAARFGVRLSLRIGVHTGELVAHGGGELTLMGETVTTAERMEASAPLNTVLVSATTRAAAARRFRFEPAPDVELKGGGTVAAFRPLASRKRVAEHGARSARAESSASLQVGGQKQYVLQEERKVVTIIFADVSVVEGRLSPAEHRTVYGTYFSDVAHEIERLGGTIDKYIGDAVMAVFGAPISHDDDGARAIAAGLAIHSAIRRRNVRLERERGVRLAARIGVNTGEVVAGLLPGDVVAYTVTGDAVNTAQRIESVAPLGELLVSESTRALARGAYVFQAVLPLTLKGKAEPVPAYRVVGTESTGTAIEGPALVGRAEQLAWLHERYALAAAGLTQVVHVHGDAGIGKTRLVAEFLSTLPETNTKVRARANSYETATPYAVVADLLRRAYGVAPTDDEATAETAVARGIVAYEPVARESAQALFMEVLGYGTRSALGPDQKRRLLISLVREFIAQRSMSSSVVVIEDAHWMDPTSGELLASVLAQLDGLRTLVLATSREPVVPWTSEALSLEPLGDALASEMVDRVAGGTIDPATRALVLERTGGNPFFIEEVVRSLAGGSGAVPATVQDMLEARLDRLEEGPRVVAQRASVIGRTFSLPLLQRIVTRPDLEAALLELVAQRLISAGQAEPEPTFTFSHALVQEVAYRTQLIAHRRRTHVGVGDAISALYAGRLDEFVDVLAYQYGRGDDDPKARTALMAAGRRAQHLYAKQEALSYFEQATQRSADAQPVRAEAQEAMGDVLRVTGDYEPALSRYADARGLHPTDDAVAVARLRRKQAMVRHLRGQTDEAIHEYSDVLATLPEDEASERARALIALGEIRWRAGAYDEATTQLERAVESAERAGDDEALAEALKHLGTVNGYKGHLEAALAYEQRSLGLYTALGDLVGQAALHNNIGIVYNRQGRFADAGASYARANQIRERIGDRVGLVLGHVNIGRSQYQRDELADAERSYRAALEIAGSIGYASGIAIAETNLGAALVEHDAIDEGRGHLRAALEQHERAANRTYMIDVLRDLAESYLEDDPAVALETAERALAIARDAGLDTSAGGVLAVAGRARLGRGETAEAVAALEESRRLLEGSAERQDLARTFWALGAAYRRLPEMDARRAEADALIERGRAMLQELGAILELRRLDRSLARSG